MSHIETLRILIADCLEFGIIFDTKAGILSQILKI